MGFQLVFQNWPDDQTIRQLVFQHLRHYQNFGSFPDVHTLKHFDIGWQIYIYSTIVTLCLQHESAQVQLSLICEYG